MAAHVPNSRMPLGGSSNMIKDNSFFTIAMSKQVLPSALKVALVVGTILALINHGDKILSLTLSYQDCIKIVLSYLVPYGVSTWSAVEAIKAN